MRISSLTLIGIALIVLGIVAAYYGDVHARNV
jgi:hypothetical protein